eukprot:1259468-Pyramimonas_sp.AAC.1
MGSEQMGSEECDDDDDDDHDDDDDDHDDERATQAARTCPALPLLQEGPARGRTTQPVGSTS